METEAKNRAVEEARMFASIDYAALYGRQDADYRDLTKEIDALTVKLHLTMFVGALLGGVVILFLIAIVASVS